MCSWPSNVEENSSSTTLAKHVLINFLGKISYHTTKKQSFHIWTLDVNKVTVKESYGKGKQSCKIRIYKIWSLGHMCAFDYSFF